MYELRYDNANMALIEVLVPDKVMRNKANGRFLKGHTPTNKGKKRTYEGCDGTQFKQGREPHNTKYDGAITLHYNHKRNEKYYYIRIAKNKWELYHRYLWEQHNGSIPKNMILVFKDKNSLNVTLDNLMLITRAEHVNRNRNPQKMRETMQQLWKRERIRKKLDLQPITKLQVKNY